MHQKVEINSFLVTKIRDDGSFAKYDIEASIDEVENEEDHVKLKYRFVLLSNPTNVKISLDGFTTIYGNQQEVIKHLGNDEKNIPRVVNALYQEVFPFLYITSKTMQIPCPAYRLADIARSSQQGISPPLEQVEERQTRSDASDETTPVEIAAEMEKQTDVEREIRESLIEEQKITTV